MANTCNFYTFYVCPNSRCIYLQCTGEDLNLVHVPVMYDNLYVNLGRCHDDLFMFFFLPNEKKEQMAVALF